MLIENGTEGGGEAAGSVTFPLFLVSDSTRVNLQNNKNKRLILYKTFTYICLMHFERCVQIIKNEITVLYVR